MVRQDRLDCALALITHGAEIDAKDNEVRFLNCTLSNTVLCITMKL